MKAKGVIWLLILAGILLFSKYYLILPWGYSTGLALGSTFALLLVVHFIIKFKNRNNPKAEENAYVLPDSMAKTMKLIDMRVQYESSIMATFFIIMGMIAFTIYLTFFSSLSGWYKFFIAFNSFWGIVFMLSNLITSFQAYDQYMKVKKAIMEGADLLKI